METAPTMRTESGPQTLDAPTWFEDGIKGMI